MNRKDFEEAVAGSELNPYARFILMTYASHADWKEAEPEVWPGMRQVAKVTGIHRDTVKQYVDAAVTDGWLVPAQMHRRAQGYTLAQGVLVTRQLKKSRGHNNLPSDGLVVQDQWPSGTEADGLVVQPQWPSDQALIIKNNHIEEPKEQETAVASAPALPFDTEQEDEMYLPKTLEDIQPPLGKEERELVRIWRKDRKTPEEIKRLIEWQREEGEW